MIFLTRITGALLIAALFLAAPARAATTYSVTVSGTCWTGAHTINASDSGMTSKNYAVAVYNSSGSRVARSLYTAGINTSNYNLSITFASGNWPSGFCGTIYLRGMYGASDTSSSTDFAPSSTGYAAQVGFAGTYSQRTVSSKKYASDKTPTATFAYTGSCAGYVRAYADPDTGQAVFMHSVGTSCLSVSNGIKTSGSAYPNNVTFKFGTFYVAYWDGFTPNVTLSSDDRPF